MSFETAFEDEIVMRKDRKPTLIVFCDPISGPASKLFERLRPVAMAVTIIAGLVVATVLTILVLPVFYSVVFNAKERA